MNYPLPSPYNTYMDNALRVGRGWWWADCWNCGTRQAPVRHNPGANSPLVRVQANYWYGREPRKLGACSACRHTVPLLYIEERKGRNGTPARCGGACLNGKRSCDCKCQGRCHGAGRCSCEVAA